MVNTCHGVSRRAGRRGAGGAVVLPSGFGYFIGQRGLDVDYATCARKPGQEGAAREETVVNEGAILRLEEERPVALLCCRRWGGVARWPGFKSHPPSPTPPDLSASLGLWRPRRGRAVKRRRRYTRGKLCT